MTDASDEKASLMPGNTLVSVVKHSRGLSLVGAAAACAILTSVQSSSARDNSHEIMYGGFGLAFIFAVSGVVLTFLELRRSSQEAPSSLSMPAATSDLGHAVSQLSRNYDVLRQQATQGFILAGTMMTLGLCVILAGAVGDMFGFSSNKSNLTTVAGIVIEAISGLGMYLFKQTFERLNATSDRLHETWKILTAFSKVDMLPEERRGDVIATLLTRLVAEEPHAQGSTSAVQKRG